MPQYSWFGDTVRDAVKELVSKAFLVGLVHRFDHLIIMLRCARATVNRRVIAMLSSCPSRDRVVSAQTRLHEIFFVM